MRRRLPRVFRGPGSCQTHLNISEPSRAARYEMVLQDHIAHYLSWWHDCALHESFRDDAPGIVSYPLPLPFPILVLAATINIQPIEICNMRIAEGLLPQDIRCVASG